MVKYTELSQAFSGKRILITGHTGFKGSWLSILLHNFGAKLYGYSLKKNENNLIYSSEVSKLFECEKFANVVDYIALKDYVEFVSPDYIFHLAAQPLVSQSYEDPIETINTNIIGVANLLEATRNSLNINAIIIVTTDKVYFNDERGEKFHENCKLGGKDIYSASKAGAEVIVESYYHSFFKFSKIRLLTVRSGNVIGGGDFCLNRIVPDIIRSVTKKQILDVRAPNSIRPWLHVLDPLFGYLFLAAKKSLPEGQIAYNISPRDNGKKVEEIIELARAYFPNLETNYTLDNQFKESISLSLDGSLLESVGYKSKLGFEESIDLTLKWYDDYFSGLGVLDLCYRDIKTYIDYDA